MPKLTLRIVQAVREGRFLYLLIALLLYLLIIPFLHDFLRLRLLYFIFLTVILLASITAIQTNKTQTILAVALAVPMLLLNWFVYAHPSKPWSLTANFITLLFLAFITVSILIFVFTTRVVTRHVIFAAVSAYLLLGIFWSIVYAILETFYPGSFSRSPDSVVSQPGYFIYFSFVTITTLGYGDVTPLSRKAQALSVGEALIGQIYMTVLIAWLVGLYVSRKESA